jgi:hypothetical protein
MFPRQSTDIVNGRIHGSRRTCQPGMTFSSIGTLRVHSAGTGMITFVIGTFVIISTIVTIWIGQCVGSGRYHDEGCGCGGEGGCHGKRGNVGWYGHGGGGAAGCRHRCQ